MQIHRILIPLFIVVGIAVAQNAIRPPVVTPPPAAAAQPQSGDVNPAAPETPAPPAPAATVPVPSDADAPPTSPPNRARMAVPGPRTRVPGVNASSARAALPVAGALGNQENIPLAERKITEPIILPKLNGNDLAHYYTKFTGRRVVVSTAAAAAEFSFVQDPPMTYAEAAKLIKMAALIENFVFVPSDEPNTDKLLTAMGGLNPKGAGVAIFDENDELPAGDEVISYVMTFKYLKPDEAVRAYTSIIGQVGAFGSITPVPNAAAVVITENTSLIRKLIQFKEEIDKPSGDVATRFFKIQFADVETLADTLNTLLGNQQQSKTAGIQRSQSSPPPAPSPTSAPGAAAAAKNLTGGTAGEDTPIQVIPDTRTNRLFAMGRPVDLLFIEGLVSEFDTPTDQKNFLRRKLKFLAVTGFLPVASNALQRAFGATANNNGSGSTPGTTGSGRSQTGSATGANFGGNIRGGTGSSTLGSPTASLGGSSGSSFGSPSTGSSMGGGSSLSGQGLNNGQSTDTTPQSVLVGRTLLVADNITNSIVVQGTPASIEIINNLLDEIDMKPDQVMISTIFGQLELDNDSNYGVNIIKTFANNFAIQSSPTGAPFVDPASLATLTGPGTAATATTAAIAGAANFPAGVGLGVYGTIGKQVNGMLQALQATNKFNIISRPTIFTANNQMGTISSGTKIAIPTNTTAYASSTATGVGSQTTNIEYVDVDLQLQVIPLVNSNDEVTLQISLVSLDLGGSRQVGTLTTTDIDSRQITTTVTVPNNQTVVLGGLITHTLKDAVSGVPILGSIPWLGKLFSNTTKTDERKELIFFLTPKIVHDARTLEAANHNMDRHYKDARVLRAEENHPGSAYPSKKSSVLSPIMDFREEGDPADATPSNGGVLPPKGSAMTIPANGEGAPPADNAPKKPAVHKISSRPGSVYGT